MNRSIINKLQYALRLKGYVVTIPISQYYLQSGGRYVKIFRVKHKDVEIYKSSTWQRVAKFLSEILNIIKEKPATNKQSIEDYVNTKLAEKEEQNG